MAIFVTIFTSSVAKVYAGACGVDLPGCGQSLSRVKHYPASTWRNLGPEPSFAAPPDVHQLDLASGNPIIAAYQATSLSVPAGVVSIATVTFAVVGGAGNFSTLQLAADTLAGTDLSDIPWTSVPVSAEVAP